MVIEQSVANAIGYCLFASLWLGCGFLCAGFEHANFRKRYADSLARNQQNLRDNLGWCLSFVLLAGPILLVPVLISTGLGDCGWTLSTTPTESERKSPRDGPGNPPPVSI